MLTLSDYDVSDFISASARSRVQRATRKRDGRRVVIKYPGGEGSSALAVHQLEFEHHVLQKLGPVQGVIEPIEFQRSGESAALVLEDFGGENLPHGAAWSLDAFFEVAIPLATTLGAIHDRGVVHKDIKPHNILWNRATHELKIIDFHFASELSRERQDAATAGNFQGTFAYMSPEQTGRMNRELDYRSDYYSLGVTFFELLAGRLPFDAGDALAWVHCHLSKRAPQLGRLNADVPAPLSDLVARLLAKDPDARYQSAYGLVQDLEACRDSWQKERTIRPFALGAKDVSQRFQVSQKLYGREAEVTTLLEAFERASAGSSKLLLVGGYSGVGKSSLVHEIQRSVVARRGYFGEGKFQQLERNVPYGALALALRSLIRQLLRETDERLADWRRDLAQSLGADARVLVDLVPELGQILGPLPNPAPLSPAETAHLLKQLFRELVKTFARPDHPLVVFLDDLQWMDAATPGVLHDLLVHPDVRHLLVIGAYRDNEVSDGHLLSVFLRELRTERADATLEITLRPLDEAAVSHLTADTMRVDGEETRSLARSIFEKTEGNPLFINELLTTLHREGVFTFQNSEGRWRWDLAEVRRRAVTETVADLIVQRLRKMAPASQAALRVGACVGGQFDLATLALVCEVPPDQLARALWEPIVQRVILPLDANYRFAPSAGASATSEIAVRYQFQHDRVQQAAYSLAEPHELAALHLRIGRLLRSKRGGLEDERLLFEIANHLNRASSLIVDQAERAELAEINSQAGKKAKHAAAYPIAARYLDTCVELAAEPGSGVDGARAFAWAMERTECVFLANETERAGALCEALLADAPDRLALASAHSLKTRILEYQGKRHEAVATVRAGLRLFGVSLPEDHGEIDVRIGEGIGKMQGHLARVPIEELVHLPEMTDPERVMTMNLLFQVIPSAIQTYPPLFILAELWMFDLALTHGTTPVSCKNFVDCGIVQGGFLGDYRGAYRLGKVAFKVLERYSARSLLSAVHFVFAAYVSHWGANYREGFESYAAAEKAGLELGDMEHVAFACVFRTRNMIHFGRPLAECDAETKAAVAYLKGSHAAGCLPGAVPAVRALDRLLDRDGGPAACERADREAVAILEASRNGPFLIAFSACQAMVSFLLREYEGSLSWHRFGQPYLSAGAGLAAMPDYVLFHALAVIQTWTAVPEADRAQRGADLDADLEKLRLWGESCPDNFAHKHRLLRAELGRLRGEPVERVLPLYDEAIATCGASFIHMSALAHELQAECLRERGFVRMEHLMLQEAYRLYAQWGAAAKLRSLEQAHPGLFAGLARADRPAGATISISTSASVHGGGTALDLSSVLKAMLAISSEVKTDRLFATLMNTLLENAGAERGSLVLKRGNDQRLWVEASADIEDGGKHPARAVALEAAARICAEVVRFVVRTRDTVVLDDAGRSGAYHADPYVQSHGVKSILCMPIVNRGQLVSVLYLENNATAGAFTPERLSTLQVIAGQAAVSISNALLYQNLEQEVEARTQEVAQKNREISAMLDGLAQGVFTIDADLLVQPQYSKHLEPILGMTNLAGQSCLPLLFRGTQIGVDRLSAMEAALRFSFGAPTVIAEANMAHLVRQFERIEADGSIRYFEVDWNGIADDLERLTTVLVTLRDVTVLRELERTARQKSRENDVVAQVLDSGIDTFRSFCNTTRGLLEDCRDLVTTGAGLTPEGVRRLFRNVHSAKGNARLLGLTHVVDVVHAVEEEYAEIRRGERPAEAAALLAGVERIARVIREHEQICDAKLSAAGATHEGRAERAMRQLEALVEPASDADPGRLVARVRSAIRRLRAVPLAEVVKETSRIIPSLARELDKSVPELECETQDTILSPEWAAIMKDVFVQSFRNSLAHGIESGDERASVGKPAHGLIRLRAERSAQGVRVCLSDDGRGLALDVLREKLGGKGGTCDEEIALAAFAAGVSSAKQVSAVAGRGVGMDIVRSTVRARGGDVGIVFTGGRSGGFRPFELVVTLPPDAVSSPATTIPPPRLEAE